MSKKNNKKFGNYNEGGIQNLNDDCLREIFKNLSKMDLVKIERVCKRWQMVSKSSWNDFTEFQTWYFDNFGLKYKEKACFGIFSRGGFFLKDIYINLCHLRKTMCITTAEVLQIFGDYCVNIENLKLCDAGFEFSDKELKDVDNKLKNLFLNNKKLKSLTMRGICITGHCLLSLQFQSIEAIDLDFCNKNINIKYLNKAFSKLRNLKYCTMQSFKDLEIVLNGIAFDKNELVYLHLKFIMYYSKKDFSAYFAAMKNLKTIVLDYTGISKNDLLSLPSSIENFEYSDSYYEANEEKLLCVSNFINLKEIKIDGSNTFFEIISDDLCEQIRKCKELRCVKLIGCNILTDVGLLKIISLPELNTLHISQSDRITHAILPALMHLKNLHIENIKKISCDDMLNYIQNASNLEVIEFIDSNSKLDIIGFKEAFMNNKNISEIKIKLNFDFYSFKK